MESKELIQDYKINGVLNIEQIYNKFYNYVNTIIINNSKGFLEDEDIEEIISDTFLILWKNSQKLDQNKYIKPYIAGITKNLIREKMRKKEKFLSILDYENSFEIKESIDLIIEEREKVNNLKEIIKKFNTKDKEIFELYYYEAKKIKDIAIILGISEVTVKQRLYRIRKKIRKIVEKEGEDIE